MGLLSLPSNIPLLVAAHLPSLRDTARLAATCRQLHEQSALLLHSHFTGPMQQHRQQREQQQKERQLLLERLLTDNKPQLPPSQLNLCEQLLTLPPPGARAKASLEALLATADSGNVAACRMLLEHGGEASADYSMAAAASRSMLRGYIAVRRLLLEHGAAAEPNKGDHRLMLTLRMMMIDIMRGNYWQ
jgi:hypothetical protein